MGLFFNKKNKKEGGLMDVIRCDEENYLVWKWRPSGEANSTHKENAIRYGSTLRIKDGEMAIFFYKQNNGIEQDFILGPYDNTLKTANLPILTSIVSSLWNGDSPFQAEIYFINLQGNNQIKFAVPYFDVADYRFPDFTVPIAVRGQLTFNITDFKQFIKLNRLIEFDLDKFKNQISDMVKKFAKSFVSNCPQDNNISILQIERKVLEISDLMQSRLASQIFNDFGVNLKRFDLSAIEIDKESPNYADFVLITKEQQKIQMEQIGRRAQIETDIYAEQGRLGVQNQFIQAHTINKQAEVLSSAANNLGQMGQINFDSNGENGFNPTGMMMGIAMGGAMGQQMASMINGMHQTMQQSNIPKQQISTPPPPPPTTTNYMIAINGKQYGPYTIQQLQQMIVTGQFTAQTYVWCQGMTTWEFAYNRSDLATLFTPPIPPTP